MSLNCVWARCSGWQTSYSDCIFLRQVLESYFIIKEFIFKSAFPFRENIGGFLLLKYKMFFLALQVIDFLTFTCMNKKVETLPIEQMWTIKWLIYRNWRWSVLLFNHPYWKVTFWLWNLYFFFCLNVSSKTVSKGLDIFICHLHEACWTFSLRLPEKTSSFTSDVSMACWSPYFPQSCVTPATFIWFLQRKKQAQ